LALRAEVSRAGSRDHDVIILRQDTDKESLRQEIHSDGEPARHELEDIPVERLPDRAPQARPTEVAITGPEVS
jgi:hypothetical protein